MGRGLDQFLANRLTNERVFQVVNDPRWRTPFSADRIGESLQTQMDTLLAVPPPVPPPAPPKAEKKDSKDEERKPAGPITDTVNKLNNPSLKLHVRPRPGDGVPGGRQVPPGGVVGVRPAKGTSGNDLDRTASDIVSRLKKELHPAK